MSQRHLSKLYRFLVAEASGGFWRRYTVAREVRYDEDKKDDQRYVLLDRKTGTELAWMSARSLPGCCGVALLYNFKGTPHNIGELVKLGQSAATRAGYGQVIFTLKTGSDALHAACDKVNTVEAGFINGKTGNRITTVVKDLRQPGKLGKSEVVSE